MLRLVGTGARAPHGKPRQVLVTSPAAVRFAPALLATLSGAEVVAVGPATADALETAGLRVKAVGESGGVAALALLRNDTEGIWYLGAEQPSPELDAALSARGITRWAVYRTEMLPAAVRDERIDAVVFTSGRTVEAYVHANGVPELPVAVLGPTTQSVAERLGVRVSVCAARPTLAKLAEAVAGLF